MALNYELLDFNDSRETFSTQLSIYLLAPLALQYKFNERGASPKLLATPPAYTFKTLIDFWYPVQMVPVEQKGSGNY